MKKFNYSKEFKKEELEEVLDYQIFSEEMLLNMAHQNVGTESMIKFFVSMYAYLNGKPSYAKRMMLSFMKTNLAMNGWDISWNSNYTTEIKEVKVYT